MSKKVSMTYLLSVFFLLFGFVLVNCSGGGSGGGNGSSSGNGSTLEVLVTDPGTPLAGRTAITKNIDAAGGSLTSDDGLLQVDVPAGAVSASTEFSITPVTNPASNSIVTYELKPEGVNFAKKVKLTISAPNAGVTRTGLKWIGIAYRKTDGSWEWVSVTRDTVNKTVSAEVDHFCQTSQLEGVQLVPLSGSVQIKKTLQLQVMTSLPLEESNDPLASLTPVYKLRPIQTSEFLLTNWSVNGTAGGNSTYGTVAGGDTSAVFTAPGDRPNPETVAVSVEALYASFSGSVSLNQYLLISSITIIKESSYVGNFTVSAHNMGSVADWTAKGQATITPKGNYEYTMTGTVTADNTVYYGNCILNGTARPFTYESVSFHLQEDPPTMYWVIPNLSWSATCDGTNVTNFLILNWASGMGADWVGLDKSVYPQHLKGSYTFPPMTSGAYATITWDFVRQD
ncbi:MAG: hypothetical protein ABFD82_23440 [Syntrophaceae bacterium]